MNFGGQFQYDDPSAGGFGGGGFGDAGGGGGFDAGAGGFGTGGGGGGFGGGGFGDAGGFQEGGFGGSQGGAVGGAGGGMKNRDAVSLTPCTVRQLLDATNVESTKFELDGCPLFQVEVVACVMERNPASTVVSYQVEDGSGRIEVKVWNDDKEGAPAGPEIVEGQYVRVVGNLRLYASRRNVVAFSIRPVTDFDEVTAHLLHVLYVHARRTIAPAFGKADASQPGGAAAAAVAAGGMGSAADSSAAAAYVPPGSGGFGAGAGSGYGQAGHTMAAPAALDTATLDAQIQEAMEATIDFASVQDITHVLQESGVATTQDAVLSRLNALFADGVVYNDDQGLWKLVALS